jgi:hypothetical protein
MTERQQATIERAYNALDVQERKLVDYWSTYSEDDRQAYWSNMTPAARRVVYMLTDGRPGI